MWNAFEGKEGFNYNFSTGGGEIYLNDERNDSDYRRSDSKDCQSKRSDLLAWEERPILKLQVAYGRKNEGQWNGRQQSLW